MTKLNKTINLGESKRVTVTESGPYAGSFDRACARARGDAVCALGGEDGSGHMLNVNGWDRSSCYIEVIFIGMKMILDMGGVCYVYSFDVIPRESERE